MCEEPAPIVDLGLGEGIGALLTLPLVQAGAGAVSEIATFDAGLAEKPSTISTISTVSTLLCYSIDPWIRKEGIGERASTRS